MTPLRQAPKVCENHADRQALFVASMPTPTKVDGKYTRDFFLCKPCGERLHAIGFTIVEINEEIGV